MQHVSFVTVQIFGWIITPCIVKFSEYACGISNKGSPYSIAERRVPELIPSQPLRELLPVLLLDEQRHDGCEQFAEDSVAVNFIFC